MGYPTDASDCECEHRTAHDPDGIVDADDPRWNERHYQVCWGYCPDCTPED